MNLLNPHDKTNAQWFTRLAIIGVAKKYIWVYRHLFVIVNYTARNEGRRS